MKVQQLQPAYLLHARAFRETSVIVDFLTRDFGKVSAVARGARTQRSKFRGFLQAFIPLLISWSGKSDLVTLTQLEPSAAPMSFSGDALLSALYVNELCVRLLPKQDPHPDIYNLYHCLLQEFIQPKHSLAVSLRGFESRLLELLGYGFDWQHTADTGEVIVADHWYVFIPEQGFFPATAVQGNHLAFPGAHILAMANDVWHDIAVMRTAKQLMRAALTPLLGGKPIRSRELFERA